MKKVFTRFIVFAILIAILGNICVTPVMAAHTHKGVMCGKQLTWYEDITATTHVKVTANENKCSCGEVIGTIDEVRKKENHSFSGDTCTKCDYTKKHEHKGVACGKQKSWYEQKNSTSHTYYTANENLCSCGKVLGYIDQKSTVQNHTFSGDTCTKCNYTRVHEHKGVMCGKQIVEYYQKDSKTHSKYTANENICSCGAMLGYIDQKTITENHSFSGDTCTKCNYTKAHEHKGVMCGAYIVEYYYKDTKTHTKYTANENICSCGAMIGYIDEKTTTENHDFDDDTCVDCGYTKAHEHKGVMCGDTIVWYEYKSSTKHTFHSMNENVCSCGEFIGYIDEITHDENHTFDSDGWCSACGYQKPHEHKGIMCGNKYTWCETWDDETHTIVTMYEDLCECGALVGYTDEVRQTGYHTFDKNDICTVCNYQYVHYHQGAMCGKFDSWYQDINEKTHTYVTAFENLCSCGENLGWTDKTTCTSDHVFYNDQCIECGYEREHMHEGVMCGQYIVELQSYNEYTHTYKYAFENLCSCGQKLGLIDESWSTTDHIFINDKCNECGYERVHVHEGAMCGKPESWYSAADANGHTLVTANEMLCSCGEMLGYCDQVEKVEAHSYLNGVCTKCSYDSSDGHLHVGSITANNAFTFYSYVDQYKHHRIFYEGDHLCFCGEFVESGAYTTYEEGHSIENGVCIHCGAEAHEHKPAKAAEKGVYYVYSSDTQHVRVTISSGHYCECGEFLIEDSESVKTSYESHIFSNQKCIECGYSNKSYGQVVLEQSLFGDFSEDVNAGGVAGQILIGEIPFVGFVADVRDLIASETPLDVAVNLIGFIPLVGSLKYGDEVYTVVKHTDDVLGLMDNADEIYAAAKAVLKNTDEAYAAGKVIEVSRVADNFDEGFDSYKDFKKVYGSAGPGYEWHHIVEQSQLESYRSAFDPKLVQNPGNIIPLDAATHRKVSGYYSRTVPGTNLSFRDWIASKNFTYEQQQKIGEYVLEIYGVKVK